MFTFDFERVCDAPNISNLLNIVFGESRFEKASYALRQNCAPMAPLCQVVRSNGKLVASIRYWRVCINDLITGGLQQALLLGPLAVDPSFQGNGAGSALITRTLSTAAAMGHQRIILVGDACFYGRFGFVPTLPSYITLPGGRDARRLLVKQSAMLPSLPAVGRVRPQLDATCPVVQSELAIAS